MVRSVQDPAPYLDSDWDWEYSLGFRDLTKNLGSLQETKPIERILVGDYVGRYRVEDKHGFCRQLISTRDGTKESRLENLNL